MNQGYKLFVGQITNVTILHHITCTVLLFIDFVCIQLHVFLCKLHASYFFYQNTFCNEKTSQLL